MCSSVAGLSSPAISFAPSVSAPAVASSVSSGSEGCVPRLPAYRARRLRSLLRFPLLSLSFSMAYLLVPPPSSVLPSAPFSFSAPLASSQPVGTCVSVSLGSGGAMVGERRRFRMPMRRWGVVCLIRFRRAYILTRCIFQGVGEFVTPEFVLRLRVLFEKCYHLLPPFFLTFYLRSLNPLILRFGSKVLVRNDEKNFWYTCQIYVG